MYNLFKLNNGLRVAAESIDYVNSISVGLWVENGSRNENIYNNGISHFIEHMLFKGTYNKTAKEIVETIENVGGQINAFTGKEATCFYIKALDTHLELALELISDMLFNSKYSEEDIEKEKNVVIEEINMNEDTPEDVLSDLHCRAIWDNDSLALPILGSINTVKSFSRDQIKNYVSSYYVPEKSVISICGKFDMKKIESLVIKYFGNWVCDNRKLTDYSSPMFSNKCLFKEKNIEQLHISLGLIGMETGNDDIYALLLLNNMLGGGASSQLFQKIREEKGMCYSIYSYLSSFKNTGVIIVYAGLNPDNAVDAVNQIKDEIEEFSVSSISDEKLIKAKEQLKGNYILGLESTSSRMFNNGKYVLFLDRILTPEEIIKKVDDVNIDKLHRVMDLTFRQGIKNSAFVGENVDADKLKIILEGDTIAFKNQKVQGFEDLPTPRYMTEGSVGMDLYAAVTGEVIKPHEIKIISTGICLQLQKGYEGQVRPRSGLAKNYGISLLNSPGTIDWDYRGEIKVIMINHGNEDFIINRGDRIAQIVFHKVEIPIIELVEELDTTDRGSRGFGSTGK